jgi:hypothetical protein
MHAMFRDGAKKIHAPFPALPAGPAWKRAQNHQNGPRSLSRTGRRRTGGFSGKTCAQASSRTDDGTWQQQNGDRDILKWTEME